MVHTRSVSGSNPLAATSQNRADCSSCTVIFYPFAAAPGVAASIGRCLEIGLADDGLDGLDIGLLLSLTVAFIDF